ncbi:3-isopropylmalate dehydratase small subunit [Parasphingopyxis algicola]|uniref:3-isopropylmalate dehydratase small subunit n=1 Tax=Parasphingopyxis algicola TaxID=2026624 RepID=UPI0015A13DDC|nr:3-isopropylmalate dehydratase small subunit [Parasphingopyxis algicola]QLC26052.1 3-isopropylmalate dehydratase small subunit [Parasphingopyxis algicola]
MAEPLTTLTALPAPMIRDNVDTDQIIPSREMTSTGKTGIADGLFAGQRYTKIGGRKPNPDFVLNRPEHAETQILLGGRNFGCGSSREHAVWALAEYGIRAIIAESFAPIFAGNCVRNGVLPAALERDDIKAIAAADAPVTIDLPAQTITLPDGRSWAFDIGEEAKAMLLEGLDAIDLTLKNAEDIAIWQAADRKARPWIYLGDRA